MKTIKTILVLLIFGTSVQNLIGQIVHQPGVIEVTPNGSFDRVSDRIGRTYNLIDLNLNSAKPFGNTVTVNSAPTSSCQAGRFIFYFAANSVFSVSAYQTVMCEVGRNISSLLVSPIANPAPVRIYCRTYTGLGSFIGFASPIYAFPQYATNLNQGFLRNQAEQTLISGVDAYNGLSASFLTTSNMYYHGYMEASAISNINTNLNTLNINSGDYDLYSILLHEMTHMLGFTSLMSYNGSSQNMPANNSYSTYDRFLCDYNGTPLLAPINSACPTSSVSFVGASTAIAPIASCSPLASTIIPIDITNTCTLAARYIGLFTNVKVYTPDCFETGSSLAHFEDMCSGTYGGTCAATPTTSGSNNLYFAMSNSISTGSCYVKRFLKFEEEQVLCDLGYSVTGTYTSAALLTGSQTQINYPTGYCAPANVIGINDGINGNNYTYTTTTAVCNIPINSVLANDIPSSGLAITCVEVVYNDATFINTGSVLSVTANAGVGAGFIVLKYVPQNTLTGQYGNATYIFVNFAVPGCSPSNICTIIENGGFESTLNNNCGAISLSSSNNPVALSCWESYSAGSSNAPGLLLAGCTSTNGLQYNLGISTFNINPPVSSHNGTLVNTHVPALDYIYFGTITNGLQNKLNAPLVPSVTYQVSFWVLNRTVPQSTTITSYSNSPCVISLATYSAYPITTNTYFPFGLSVCKSFTINPLAQWTQVTGTFVLSPSITVNQTNFLIGMDWAQTNPIATLTPSTDIKCFIDDVEITIVSNNSPSLALPSNTICNLQGYQDLGQYFPIPASFSGPAVTISGTQYNFNDPPSASLTGGIYPITITYTTGSGCVTSLIHAVTIGTNCCSSAGQTLGAVAINTISTFNGPMLITNDFTVQSGGSVGFSGDVRIASNVKITVENGGGIYLNGAHLSGCGTDMWTGIEIQDGAEFSSGLGTGGDYNLIEDAKIAVDASSTTSSATSSITVFNTIFNRNRIGIKIANFVRSTPYPLILSNSIFTCRNLPSNGNNWPQGGVSTSVTSSGDLNLRYAFSPTTGLVPPFIDQSGLIITNLKSPYSSQTAYAGVQLANVGITNITTTAAITVGSYTDSPTDFNLFDAMHIGIESTNSNLISHNNVFQNSQTMTNVPGTGIKANNNYSVVALYATKLVVGGSPATANLFYDCQTGVDIRNLSCAKIKYAEFKSTQSVTNTPTANSTGKFGITVASNQFKGYEIELNKFANVQTGIYATAHTGILQFGSFSQPTVYGQAWSFFGIHGNFFSSAVNANTAQGNGYMSDAVVIQTPVFTPGNNVSQSFQGYSPLDGIIVGDNIMDRVWRGITVNGFGTNNFAKSSGGNTITLVADANSAPQWGIAHLDNMISVVNSNKVTGYSILITDDVRGILNSMNANSGARCNHVEQVPRCMEFGGTNANMVWRQNTMVNGARGLQLSGTGLTGGIWQQGDATHPSDNYWLDQTPGQWNTRLHTYTDANSYPNNSALYIRAITGFTPTSNGNANNNIGQTIGGIPGSLNAASTTSIIPCYTLNTENGDYATQQAIELILNGDPETDEGEVAQYLLFQTLNGDTVLRNSNDTILAFYQNNLGEPMGVLANIEELLAAGKLSDANTQLSGFSPNGNVETNFKNYYEIYSAFAATDSLSATDDEHLMLLAAQCPYSDGAVVYKARALYDFVHHTVSQYSDENCITQGYAGRLFNASGSLNNSNILNQLGANESSKPIKKRLMAEYKIMPNPASDVIYVKGSKGNEKLQVIVNDVNGRVVKTESLTMDGKLIPLKLDLTNGIYFVNLVNENGFRTVKKLIIAK